MIYLDNNATTRPDARVVAAVSEALVEAWANPSSIHRPGQEARRRVELARQAVARLIGAKPKEIVFTSGGTESIDLAIRGVLGARRAGAGARRDDAPPVVVSTAVEHAAVRDLLAALVKSGDVELREAPLEEGGIVDVAALERLLDEIESTGADAGGKGGARGRIALVSIQWANNETGAVQPVEAIGRACRARKILFHCDGVQWVGKAPAEVGSIGAGGGAPGAPFDLLSMSAHKMHGPKGVGALWIRKGVRLAPALHGAHEMDRRGGTENVPGILGFGAAAEIALDWLADEANAARIAALRDRFEQAVLSRVPDARINAPPTALHPTSSSSPSTVYRLPSTTNIAFPRLEAEALLMLLSERGVCASAGAACSSGSLEPSPVLLAMGIPPEYAHGSLRFSLSKETTEREIDEAIGIVAGAVERLRGSMGAVGR